MTAAETDRLVDTSEQQEQQAEGSGQRLYRKAKLRIPGGTQLLSKRPEMFLPEQWPAYYSRAEGAEVWDLDGRRFIDMSNSGIGSCLLGFADPDVNAAVIRAVTDGSMATLNCVEEVELADVLCELHPWADMVRYTRSGGEAMAMAVRIARASTGRDRVAFCGYHGWHDWYLAANLAEEDALDGHLLQGLEPRGVPRALRGTALPFAYNRLDELEAIAARHGSELAAIVMEPIRATLPDPGFLERARSMAAELGAVFIFDEITAGFRLALGGAHRRFGVDPDIAVFAKAMSNGFPLGAVIGRREHMDAAQRSFISSTYWTERVGPAAALATIRKHRELGVAERLAEAGRRIMRGWQEAGTTAGLSLHVSGLEQLPHFAMSAEDPQAARTLFTQLMLDRGYLAGTAVYVTFAHTDDLIDRYLEVAVNAFGIVARAVRDGTVHEQLRGPVAHAGFRRLT